MTPRPLTLVMAYYENGGMLREQIRLWSLLPPYILEQLHVIVVDDGTPASSQHAEANCDGLLGVKLASFELWRMDVDVRWNQDACRNLGVREAKTQWVVLTDMDHVVPEKTWKRLMIGPLEPRNAYRFARRNADGTPYKPHPNSWAMTRKMFWGAGGYDEALCGYYGTDGDFLNRVRRQAGVFELEDPLVRYSREVIPDASTTSLTRKSEHDKEFINSTIKGRALKQWVPLHFQTPASRVL